MSKAITLYQAIKSKLIRTKKTEENSIVKKAEIDISYLRRFNNYSTDLKELMVKSATELGCNRCDIFDMFTNLDSNRK